MIKDFNLNNLNSILSLFNSDGIGLSLYVPNF